MSIVTNLQICVDLHWCGKLDFSSQFFSLFSIRLWYSQTCVLWLCSTFYQRRQNVIGICEKSSLYYLAVKISKTVTFNNLKAKNKKQKQKQNKPRTMGRQLLKYNICMMRMPGEETEKGTEDIHLHKYKTTYEHSHSLKHYM